MYVTRAGLQFRKQHASLLLKGDYIPLQVEGAHRECVVAFRRRHRGDSCLIIVPRLTTRLVKGEEAPVGMGVWDETRLILPKENPCKWTNVFDGQSLDSSEEYENQLLVGRILQDFPVALLSNAYD
jgi:(1->4)-alpha-D-glucan 1-alpha-D-glucosylmutase